MEQGLVMEMVKAMELPRASHCVMRMVLKDTPPLSGEILTTLKITREDETTIRLRSLLKKVSNPSAVRRISIFVMTRRRRPSKNSLEWLVTNWTSLSPKPTRMSKMQKPHSRQVLKGSKHNTKRCRRRRRRHRKISKTPVLD